MDEITTAHEVEMVERLCCSGVGVLASCHASELDELELHPFLSHLAADGLFSRALVISRRDGKRTYGVKRLRE